MAEVNLIKTPDMGTVNAIDFVNSFENTVNAVAKVLGVAKPYPLKQGSYVQLYKFEVTKPNGGVDWGIVPEGDDIPLTHVKRVDDQLLNVAFRKYRKAVTIEEVQRVGYERASIDSDKAVLREVQKDIRGAMLEAFSLNPTEITAGDLQDAIGKLWGQVANSFDNDEIDTVYFVNPLDAGDYLGSATIQNGEKVGFGLTLLGGFANATILVTNGVPQGKVYATAKDNLSIVYVDGVNGETAKMFHGKNVLRDETGLINYVKEDNTTNATEQALIYTGISIYPEITNGVFVATLGGATEEPETP